MTTAAEYPRCVEELLDIICEIQDARIEGRLLIDFGGWNSLTSFRGRPIENVVESL